MFPWLCPRVDVGGEWRHSLSPLRVDQVGFGDVPPPQEVGRVWEHPFPHVACVVFSEIRFSGLVELFDGRCCGRSAPSLLVLGDVGCVWGDGASGEFK